MRANIDIIVFKRLTFFVHFFFFFFGGLRSLHRHRIEEEEDNQLMSAELLLILNLLFFLWSVSILNSDFGVRASPLPAPMPRYIYIDIALYRKKVLFCLVSNTLHNAQLHTRYYWMDLTICKVSTTFFRIFQKKINEFINENTSRPHVSLFSPT